MQLYRSMMELVECIASPCISSFLEYYAMLSHFDKCSLSLSMLERGRCIVASRQLALAMSCKRSHMKKCSACVSCRLSHMANAGSLYSGAPGCVHDVCELHSGAV